MRLKTQASERRRRRAITVGWIALLSIVVISLIYWEQTAILYILATLGVTALLIVVAVSDLGEATRSGESPETTASSGTDKVRSAFEGSRTASN